MEQHQTTMNQEIVERCQHWWFCENIINHPEQIALLRMDFPRVFILIRDNDSAYSADYDTWANEIVEVNFFSPSERIDADLDEILTDAWNFMISFEKEEERQYELHNGYKDEWY